MRRIAVLALAVLAASCQYVPPPTTSPPPPSSPPPVVPAQHRELYEDLGDALDDANSDPRLAGDAGVDTTWATELLVANGNRGEALLGPNVPAAVRLILDRYVELGVAGVTVAAKYPLLATWFPRHDEYAAFYAQVASEVRARGLRLLVDVGPLFTGTVFSSVVVDPARLTLARVTDDLHAIAQRAIDLMHPDWLVIIDEPDTAAALTGVPAIAELEPFIALVNEVIDGLVRGDTMLVAGAGTWMSSSYLAALAQRTDIDVLGVHVYPVSRAVIDTTIAAVGAARRAGKSVVLDEAWLYKAGPGDGGGPAMAADVFRRDAFSFWEPLDLEFLSLLDRLATSQGLTYVAPFWSGLFFANLAWTPELEAMSYADLNRVLQARQSAALQAGGRSALGERFAALLDR